MMTKLFDGITKLEQKPGVCVNTVTFVLPALAAGLMETAPMTQSLLPEVVHEFVTDAAPGCVLAPDATLELKYVFQSAVWFAPGLPTAPKFWERKATVSNTSSPGAEVTTTFTLVNVAVLVPTFEKNAPYGVA